MEEEEREGRRKRRLRRLGREEKENEKCVHLWNMAMDRWSSMAGPSDRWTTQS